MAISRVNEPCLILEGVRAASWLAAQSCRIGMDAPALYAQGTGGKIYKINSEICVVTGNKLYNKIQQEWAHNLPEGIVLHDIGTSRQQPLQDILHRCS